MAGQFSRNKGQRGEREVIKLLQPIVDRAYKSYPAFGAPPRLQRNTLQSDFGGYDVIGLEWLALEVKFQESLSINQWWKQTEKQAKEGQEPVLFYRQSYKPWVVMMRMEKTIVDRKFHCRSTITIQDFLIYFEHRLFRNLKVKAAFLEEFRV